MRPRGFCSGKANRSNRSGRRCAVSWADCWRLSKAGEEIVFFEGFGQDVFPELSCRDLGDKGRNEDPVFIVVFFKLDMEFSIDNQAAGTMMIGMERHLDQSPEISK